MSGEEAGESMVHDTQTGEGKDLPWIRTYGLTPAESAGALDFNTGWRAAKTAVAGAACPFEPASIAAAAWHAAIAFHQELGR